MNWLSETNKNPLLTDWNVIGKGAPACPQPCGNLGIDFIHAGFDVNPNFGEIDSEIWSIDRWGSERVPDYMHPQLFLTLPFRNTNVEVELRSLDMRCYLRFNPSRAVHGKSRQLLEADELQSLVEELLDALQPYVYGEFDAPDPSGQIVRVSDWPKYISLSRVDIARNLLIDDAEQFKRLAAAAQPKNNPLMHSFGKKGKSWGLANATATVGQDRLYDKNADLKRFLVAEKIEQQEAEWFRFEAELRADRLVKHGLNRLDKITNISSWQAVESRWEASRWGVMLSEPGTVVNAVDGLSVHDKINLLGYLSMHILGREDEIPQSRHRKYGALARNLGLTPGEDFLTLGKATRKVDFWEGKIVNL